MCKANLPAGFNSAVTQSVALAQHPLGAQAAKGYRRSELRDQDQAQRYSSEENQLTQQQVDLCTVEGMGGMGSSHSKIQ